MLNLAAVDDNKDVATKEYVDGKTAVTGVKGNSESSYRTGQVNITAANIGINDYVTSTGSGSGWTWRKWNSGMAECWGNFSQTLSITTTYGSIYESASFNKTFPSGLFNATPQYCGISWNGNSNNWILGFELGGSMSSTRTQDFCGVKATSGSVTGTVMIYAKGTWK